VAPTGGKAARARAGARPMGSAGHRDRGVPGGRRHRRGPRCVAVANAAAPRRRRRSAGFPPSAPKRHRRSHGKRVPAHRATAPYSAESILSLPSPSSPPARSRGLRRDSASSQGAGDRERAVASALPVRFGCGPASHCGRGRMSANEEGRLPNQRQSRQVPTQAGRELLNGCGVSRATCRGETSAASWAHALLSRTVRAKARGGSSKCD
jgi:hypothetical protein